ncbi:hypothetical protein CYMTET_20729 [Cymbomonas tetramitiformis]|uniref:Uncharacterized protein n=1 Tax=Cymbomonas tetramitiformis TaxID=36881 RepID=A0AAE0G3G9_9CHLO|nr:hypothetical protein CYMTET_20729 [Cymbomonas tetramitiformis]
MARSVGVPFALWLCALGIGSIEGKLKINNNAKCDEIRDEFERYVAIEGPSGEEYDHASEKVNKQLAHFGCLLSPRGMRGNKDKEKREKKEKEREKESVREPTSERQSGNSEAKKKKKTFSERILTATGLRRWSLGKLKSRKQKKGRVLLTK